MVRRVGERLSGICVTLAATQSSRSSSRWWWARWSPVVCSGSAEASASSCSGKGGLNAPSSPRARSNDGFGQAADRERERSLCTCVNPASRVVSARADFRRRKRTIASYNFCGSRNFPPSGHVQTPLRLQPAGTAAPARDGPERATQGDSALRTGGADPPAATAEGIHHHACRARIE